MKSILGVAALMLVGWVFSTAPARAQFPDGPGKLIVQEACSVCHGTDVIASMRRSKAEWTETVQDMVSRGAPLVEGERELVIEYLAANFGPDKPLDKGAMNGKKSPVVPAVVNAANASPSWHDFSRAGENAPSQRFQPLRAAPQGLKPHAN